MAPLGSVGLPQVCETATLSVKVSVASTESLADLVKREQLHQSRRTSCSGHKPERRYHLHRTQVSVSTSGRNVVLSDPHIVVRPSHSAEHARCLGMQQILGLACQRRGHANGRLHLAQLCKTSLSTCADGRDAEGRSWQTRSNSGPLGASREGSRCGRWRAWAAELAATSPMSLRRLATCDGGSERGMTFRLD